MTVKRTGPKNVKGRKMPDIPMPSDGNPIWSGVFDTRDGTILETHSYQQAAAADFHHSMYCSPSVLEMVKEGDAQFFWLAENGNVKTEWKDAAAPAHIIEIIERQLRGAKDQAARRVTA